MLDMTTRKEIDRALNTYHTNYGYIQKIWKLDFDVYRERFPDGEYGQSAEKLFSLVRKDAEKITEIINAFKLLNKAYRDGDSDTKWYITTSIAKITDHRYDPEDGTVLQFLQNELGYMRMKKTELEGMLKEADANYVPPIPRKAKKSSAKTRKRKTPTKKSLPTAKRFGENLIKTAMRLGGFNR